MSASLGSWMKSRPPRRRDVRNRSGARVPGSTVPRPATTPGPSSEHRRDETLSHGVPPRGRVSPGSVPVYLPAFLTGSRLTRLRPVVPAWTVGVVDRDRGDRKACACPMIERKVTVRNRAGLHTRPASMLVRTASQFDAEIFLRRENYEINGKSVIGVMTLAAEKGATLTRLVDGDDEEAAAEASVTLFEDGFGEEM